MSESNYIYHHGELACHGYLALPQATGPKPAVLVFHDWSGRNDFACAKAKMLADMGYVGFAVDMYGEGRQGHTLDEKKALMQPLALDRNLLTERAIAALDAVVTLAEVDHLRIAAIGFCFGGLCVLDLARSGADVQGVVSFHGLLNPAEQPLSPSVKAKVLVLHGYDDPMVPPEQVNAFCREMTQAKVDWQVHMYGHAQHAFSNPQAQDAAMGTIYNPQAEQRSLQAMAQFLKALF
ncbi:MAG: dienelactone hydrolase family protein [Legionellaceae bacterium]|nr:dienelactone hydrolase family protein [Legionellaceae bacterium]